MSHSTTNYNANNVNSLWLKRGHTNNHSNNKNNNSSNTNPKDESGLEYLESHCIPQRLTESISTALANSYNTNNIHNFNGVQSLANDLKLIDNNQHVLFKSFKYINSSISNRKSFINEFYNIFGTIEPEPNTPDELYQLLLLLCNDFPYSLVKNASRIININHINNKQQSLIDRLLLLFYYSEFLNSAALSFRNLDTSNTGKINKTSFYNAILDIIKAKHNSKTKNNSNDISMICPTKEDMKQAIEFNDNNNDDNTANDSSPLIMFNSFCVNLFQNPNVVKSIRT